METQASIEIGRPVEEVFETATTRVAEWSATVVEDVSIDALPEGVGSLFRVVTEERGRRMTFAGIVTRHEPPRFHAVHLKGELFDIEVEYVFEDLGGRTRVTQHSLVDGKGLVRVMFKLFGFAFRRSGRKGLERDLANLKRLVESRPAPAPTA